MLELNWNILWTIINIFVLYLLMKRFLFQPVTAIMNKRAEGIKEEMQVATEKNKEAQALKEQYEQALLDARVESAVILEEARERAEAEYTRIIQGAKESANRIEDMAKKQIEQEKYKAKEELLQYIGDFTAAAALKLSENIEEAVDRKRIDSFLAEVGGMK